MILKIMMTLGDYKMSEDLKYCANDYHYLDPFLCCGITPTEQLRRQTNEICTCDECNV